ncbi:type 1 glutamine amidotransferase domain-containing protein [Cupriavidus plantarum]|uniref:type 1 glutamine amidotransferase domain-containing protein n=1 Tax=Cupriavidus plantarum TaxID=942865 RepID=UPI000E28002D|nr:type 1 glutamine amidotransferase domain-containing protein [Cupriavidus plantarum]NYI01796.1 putative intracellular protease/amidase [Cupriavidus plantarum]REE91107.1 putative intracellular protease/amidase [Cupriavidus plantarum]RLK33780.1 putative intracellular protease/amidase [Cupriavidus plantarum]
MSIKHVLFILTNTAEIGPNHRPTGYFFPEVAHPYEVFAESGVAVEYASLQGGTPPEDGYDANDPAQLAFRNSAAIRRMAHSRKLSEVDVLDYDAIFFPGGLGPMVDIARNPEIQQAVERAWQGGKIVAAVCHGPAALLGAKLEDGTPLIKGRKLTSFSNAEEAGYAQADVPFLLEDALRAEGAEYSSADVWQEKVVVDGRLMTGQNPASGGPLAKAIVEALR